MKACTCTLQLWTACIGKHRTAMFANVLFNQDTRSISMAQAAAHMLGRTTCRRRRTLMPTHVPRDNLANSTMYIASQNDCIPAVRPAKATSPAKLHHAWCHAGLGLRALTT